MCGGSYGGSVCVTFHTGGAGMCGQVVMVRCCLEIKVVMTEGVDGWGVMWCCSLVVVCEGDM